MRDRKRSKKPAFVGSVSYYALYYALMYMFMMFMGLIATGNWDTFQSLVLNFFKDQWSGVEQRWYAWGPAPSASSPSAASSLPASSAQSPITSSAPATATASTANETPTSPVEGCLSGKYTCRCQDEGVRCIKLIISNESVAETETFVCSGGLFIPDFELKTYRGFLYRNECRPRGMPPLKSCRLGQSCDAQGLKDGWPCSPSKDEVAICHCGLVLNITTPQMREDVERIGCKPHRNDAPPETPCVPTPDDPRPPISL